MASTCSYIKRRTKGKLRSFVFLLLLSSSANLSLGKRGKKKYALWTSVANLTPYVPQCNVVLCVTNHVTYFDAVIRKESLWTHRFLSTYLLSALLNIYFALFHNGIDFTSSPLWKVSGQVSGHCHGTDLAMLSRRSASIRNPAVASHEIEGIKEASPLHSSKEESEINC